MPLRRQDGRQTRCMDSPVSGPHLPGGVHRRDCRRVGRNSSAPGRFGKVLAGLGDRGYDCK
eukprot:6192174-Lingulodinium_polyedra.AAC.1